MYAEMRAETGGDGRPRIATQISHPAATAIPTAIRADHDGPRDPGTRIAAPNPLGVLRRQPCVGPRLRHVPILAPRPAVSTTGSPPLGRAPVGGTMGGYELPRTSDRRGRFGAAAAARPRAPRRRVEQGRGDDGQVRRRGRRGRWSPPAPAASGARSSTRRWTAPDVLANIAEIRRGRDGAGPARSSASTRSGWASSTPGCPRATRCRRCPRAPSPPLDVAEARPAAGQADPRRSGRTS